MVYVFGVLGFICGFIFGQMTLMFLLRNIKTEDLLEDKFLRFKYGMINWAVAFLGGYGAITIYERWFLSL